MAKKQHSDRRCSFCGMPIPDDEFMLAGVSGHICSHCIHIANDILRDYESHNRQQADDFKVKLIKPHEIKAKLDEYVIGQDEAKKVISVAVYNHYKRIMQPSTDDEVEIEKSIS